MTFDWVTFGLQTLNFLILVWLLHRFLYRPVLGLIAARRLALEKQQDEVARLEAATKAALDEVTAQRHGIAEERAAALAAAAAEAETAAAAAREKAQTAAAALLAEARKTVAQERAAMLTEARHLAVDLGVGIAGQLMAEIPLAQRAEAWLQGVERYLADLAPSERQGLAGGAGHDARLEIVTAVPLPAEIAAAWSARLIKAIGHELVVRFAAEPSLVGGAELHFPGAVLHLSWRDQIAALRSEA